MTEPLFPDVANPGAPPAAQPPDPVPGWPAGMPPPVLPEECARLRARIAAVARGDAVLLQGGGRAGLPVGRTEGTLREWMRILLEMELPLAYATGLPVVKVGWTVGAGSGAPAGGAAGSAARVYGDAVVALNLIRALSTAAPEPWQLSPAPRGAGAPAAPYRDLAAAIGRGLDLVEGYGLEYRAAPVRREFFVGNEGVPSDYERALTVSDGCAAPGPGRLGETSRVFATSGHLQWLRAGRHGPDDADIARLAGTGNAVAFRVGPGTRPDTVLRVLDALDPHREPGRLTLVVGLGADRVTDLLPVLVEKARAEGAEICWLTDPLRGGVEPRRASEEVRRFVEVHRALGGHPGGVHVEPLRTAPEAGRRLLLDVAYAFAEACSRTGRAVRPGAHQQA